MKKVFALLLAVCIVLSMPLSVRAVDSVTAYTMPQNLPQEYVSTNFSVSASGIALPVYNVGQNVWNANVAYCAFDFTGTVTLSVTTNFNFTTARVLPRNAGINCTKSGNTVTFTLNSAQNVTILFDENFQGKAIHIFAQEPETNIPEYAAADGAC